MESAAEATEALPTTTAALRGQVGRIQSQVKEIQEVVRLYSSTTGPRRMRRPKTQQLADDKSHTNPYSRLMALQSAGAVPNYERIRDYSVALVGIGGVGIGVAEMLTRCGVGKLALFDCDVVELANMNKMFYRPEQTGWAKTMAARHYCAELNPDVEIEAHNLDVTADDDAPKFRESLAAGALKRGAPVSLVIGCVDNMEARRAIETVCAELHLPYLDATVADDAMSAHVQLIIPGRTAGLDASPIQSHMPRGSCPGSLPTTDSIVAGLVGQNALKYLLGFGEVAFLTSYNAITNEFVTRMA